MTLKFINRLLESLTLLSSLQFFRETFDQPLSILRLDCPCFHPKKIYFVFLLSSFFFLLSSFLMTLSTKFLPLFITIKLAWPNANKIIINPINFFFQYKLSKSRWLIRKILFLFPFLHRGIFNQITFHIFYIFKRTVMYICPPTRETFFGSFSRMQKEF